MRIQFLKGVSDVRSHRVNGNIQLLADGLRGTATRDHFEYFDFSFAENRQRFVSVGFGALGPALKGMNEGLGVGGVHVLGDGKLEKRFEDVARSDHAPYNLLLFGQGETILDRSACSRCPSLKYMQPRSARALRHHIAALLASKSTKLRSSCRFAMFMMS